MGYVCRIDVLLSVHDNIDTVEQTAPAQLLNKYCPYALVMCLCTSQLSKVCEGVCLWVMYICMWSSKNWILQVCKLFSIILSIVFILHIYLKVFEAAYEPIRYCIPHYDPEKTIYFSLSERGIISCHRFSSVVWLRNKGPLYSAEAFDSRGHHFFMWVGKKRAWMWRELVGVVVVVMG